MVVVCCAAGLPPGVYVQEPSLTPHSLTVGASEGNRPAGSVPDRAGCFACLLAGLLAGVFGCFFHAAGAGGWHGRALLQGEGDLGGKAIV